MENIKKKLEEFSELLAHDLQLIAQKNFSLEEEEFSKEVSTLIFEYFFPQLEIAFYPINANEDQLGYKDLLNGLGILKDLPASKLEELEIEKSNSSAVYRDLGNTFVHWFAKIWEESGGLGLGINAFLLTDDESLMKFDLNKKTWIKDESYK